jgi:hypothetical protein
MITVPADWPADARITHEPQWRGQILDAAGAVLVDGLGIRGGRIVKDAARNPRCSIDSLEIPTESPVPSLIDQHYLPVGGRIRLQHRIAPDEAWTTIADCDMVRSTIARPDSTWRLTAMGREARIALDDTARGTFALPNGTMADAIRYIVNRTFPGTVFDITGPATTTAMPAGGKGDGDPWRIASGIAVAAGSEIYFRGHDRVCVVRAIPDLAVTAVDTVDVGATGVIQRYDLDHEMGYNTVCLVYQNQAGSQNLITGTWTDTRTDSPVAVQRIGSHVVYRETRKADIAPTQASADLAAAALGRRVAAKSRAPTIRHIARPWLEPGDTVAVAYAGGPTELQLVDSVSIDLDGSNMQTTICRSHAYKMGVPVR